MVDWAQCAGDGPEAAAGRRLLLAEVNAAIEGALTGGLSHTYNPRAVVKEPASRVAAHSLHPARACALVRETAGRAVAGAATDRSFCAAILLTRGIAEIV